MKPGRLLFITTLFFLFANTSYLWLQSYTRWIMPVLFIQMPVLIALVTIGCGQLYLSVRYGYYSRGQNGAVLLSVVLLFAIMVKPLGIIKYEKQETESLFTAVRPINGNCMVTLMLKENNRYKIKSSCINFDRQEGSYTVKGDTIILADNSWADFAVITHDTLVVPKNFNLAIFKTGTLKDRMYITGNKLIPPITEAVNDPGRK